MLIAFAIPIALFTACDDDDDSSETTNNTDSNSSDTNSNSSTNDSSSIVVGTAVNLGLSVKWADINVGATLPADYGYYYAWGETKTKDSFTPKMSLGFSVCGYRLKYLIINQI